ncbi:MAG: ABC transporter substrate-binding protein [Burkholderiales bacterium]|nr:ABC transporter substrate-binding protein [Anaerolineae bacterium]
MSRKFTRNVISLFVLVVIASLSLGLVAAQDAVPMGGTVVVEQAGRGQWISNFNPFLSSAISDGTRQVIYDPMIVYDPLDGGEPTWWLGTGYEYSEDLLSITFTLREGVRWSDGEDMTADDVKFTFDLVQEFPALDRLGILAFLESTEVVDDLTVQFNLTDIYSLAHILVGQQRIVPEHIWSEVEDPVLFTNDDPVGTGPFTEVTDFTSEVYRICRNPYFFMEGQPYVDCLEYPAFTGNDPSNLAIINGDIDWGGNFIPDIDNTFVALDPEHHHRWFVGVNPWGFYVNATKAPFDDVEFRHALALAIDYEAIAVTAENGYIETPPEVATGIWPLYQDWVPQSVLDKVEEMGLGTFNVERASQILEDAGYVDADGDGWRDMTDGSALSFDIQIVNGWTDVVTAAQIMSQGFQDAGLNASVVTPDQTTFQANLQNADFDTSLGWAIWRVTPWDYYDNIMNSTRVNADTGFSTGNFQSRVFSDEADALLDAFLRTSDPEEQREIIGQLADIYVTQVVSTPIGIFPAWFEYNTTRFEGFPSEEDPYAVGAPWQEETARLVAVNLHCVDDTSCGQ